MTTAYVDRMESVADVAERLMVTYDGIVPLRMVTNVVLEAARDLRGQVPPGALAEMLHQLAHHRLESLSPTGLH